MASLLERPSSSFKLKIHMWTHSGEWPPGCGQCKYIGTTAGHSYLSICLFYHRFFMAPSFFLKITVSSASKTFLPLDLSLTSLMFEPSAIWIFHPFLFLFVQQRQKTSRRSPRTSPGTLLTTSSPRGQHSHLFHLRYPPWSLKDNLRWNFQYRSWILLLNWSPYLLNDWKILVLHFCGFFWNFSILQILFITVQYLFVCWLGKAMLLSSKILKYLRTLSKNTYKTV